MTIFDYLVIFVMLASFVISILRGLIKELLSLVSWLVAFVVANAYGAALAALLPAVVPGAVIRLMLAFVLLFIGVRMLMGLLTMALEALITASGLTMADRGLGAIFGIGRGLVIVLTVVILCGMTSIPQQAFWTNAKLSAYAESAARAIKPYLPAAYAEHIQF